MNIPNIRYEDLLTTRAARGEFDKHNPMTTQEALVKWWHVVEAIKDGKEVEERRPWINDEWRTLRPNNSFDMLLVDNVEFRIKPREPRRFWVPVRKGELWEGRTLHGMTSPPVGPTPDMAELIEFVEVMKEDAK